MRFVQSYRFSPVASKIDMPNEGDLFHFRSPDVPKLKKDRIAFLKENNVFIDREWWQKQATRCIYGYDVPNAIEKGGDAFVDGVDAIWDGDDCYLPQYDLLIKNKTIHITGRHYFYINFWPIYAILPGTNIKGLTTPLFIDMDFLFARRVEMAYEQMKDSQELKARQKGFSEKEAGMLAAYNYTFQEASFNVIVAGDSKDSDHTMENCIRGLDFLINTQFYLERKRGGDNSERLIAKKTLSQIECLTAKDNPQAVSRFSPTLVLYEEVGKGKKSWSIDTAAFVKPSIYAQNGIKTGWQWFIGTGGEMSEGVWDLEQRAYNPREYNLLEFKNIWTKLSTEYGDTVSHFTPAWWMKVIDKDGNSQKVEGLKLIEKEYKEASAKDKYRFRTQTPNFIEDVFLSSDSGYFGQEAIKLLNNRYSLILNTKSLQIERQGILEWINPKKPFEGVRFIAKPNEGWLNIIEEPVRDGNGIPYQNLYEAGVDSYDQDEAKTSNSKGAMYIKKRYLPGEALYNCSVAEIIERPTIAEGGATTFYMHSVMAAMWYKTQVNIEYSNLRIFDYYTVNGFEVMLKTQPRLAFAGKIANTKVSNRYGTDKSLKPYVLAILKDMLTPDYVDHMFFARQIRALSKFVYDPTGRKYNCDITIATAEAEVACKESEMIPVRKQDEDRDKVSYKTYVTINGRIQAMFTN